MGGIYPNLSGVLVGQTCDFHKISISFVLFNYLNKINNVGVD